jgi:membrane-bound serine protease (ClpP class)
MAAEFFLPTGGILVVVALGCMVLAVGVILLYGSALEAVAAVIALCLGVPIAFGFLAHQWQRYALKGTVLDSETAAATVADAPEIAELEKLKGRFGRTVSPMRPAGSVEIDGRRIDALTEGMMLDANVWVKCVDVRAGRVIVRQVDRPGELNEFKLDDLT